MYVPQIRDNNPIRGNDEGVPILTSLTVLSLTYKSLQYENSNMFNLSFTTHSKLPNNLRNSVFEKTN